MKHLTGITLLSFLLLGACKSFETDQPPLQLAFCLSSNVQLTEEPTPDSELLRFIQVGDTLHVLEDGDEGYTYVSVDAEVDGWIENKFLALGGSPSAFRSPSDAYVNASKDAAHHETFYPLDFVTVIKSDSSGWSKVIGQPATKDSIIQAWVLSENLTTVAREVEFTVRYHRAMAKSDSSQRSRELFNLYTDPYLKKSDLLFAATYAVIHADNIP